ncbi:MAG: metallophosphoesterase [Deltaproteobacteria bacterium]|nr:metallophosphoesterase [Deltaproteobacteria bacterium]
MSLFQLIALAVLAAAFFLGVYVFRRARRVFGLKRWSSLVLGLALVSGPVLLFTGRLSLVPARWIVPAAVSGSALTLGTIFAAVLLFHVDIARGVAALAARWWPARPDQDEAESASETTVVEVEPVIDEVAGEASEEPASAPTLSRREVLGQFASGGALVLGGSLGGYSAFFGRHDYAVEEVVVALPGLPATLEGFTLVQLSDIHIGRFVGEWELRAAERLVKDARADLIVLTGDLVDHEPQYAPQLGRLVRRLVPLARHGVAAVPGNHDYYAGIDEVLGALDRGGARVLRNEGVVIGDGGGGFALLGVDDLWAGGHGEPVPGGPGPDLDRAIHMVPPDLGRVLLCHQPELFHHVAADIQLQLSGHTHGGQVTLGYEPASYVLPHGYVEGLYERHGGKLYVNRGFGTAGPPARLGAAPELTRVILTRA